MISLAEGKFADAGIRKIFIITGINSKSVAGPADVQAAFQENDGGSSLAAIPMVKKPTMGWL